MLRVKIVCTIGPTSTDPEVLAQLIDAGMNVARINMSHGDHDFHARNIHTIREIAQERNRPVAILVDLQGPKLRVGEMQPGGVPLTAGEELILTTEEIIGEPGRVPIQNKEVPASIEEGRRESSMQSAGETQERILLDDGLLELEVIEATETTVRTRVIVGGVLQDRKGMNLPQTKLTVPSMTEKDRVDVDFALEHQADWIALSFVRTAADVQALRKVVQSRAPLGRATPIISKIEKPEAVENIEEIIQASDGLMVARGDLGIETSPEAVPMIQKMIIARCIGTDKPVITATQMLESMIRNPRPTRAEASDVANAVLDGSDAIMLSGETAAGNYPVQTVQTMANIAKEAERVRSVTQPHYRPSQQAVDGFFGTVADSSEQGTDKNSRGGAIGSRSCQPGHGSDCGGRWRGGNYRAHGQGGDGQKAGAVPPVGPHYRGDAQPPGLPPAGPLLGGISVDGPAHEHHRRDAGGRGAYCTCAPDLSSRETLRW